MAKPGNRGHLVVFKNVPEKRRFKPVIVKSLGWHRSSGLTNLECESCNYKFSLESDPKNRWLPAKEPKFCPECAHPIKGCRVPYGRHPQSVMPTSSGLSQVHREPDRIQELVPTGT